MKQCVHGAKFAAWAGLSACLLLCVACGPAARPTGSVSGKVTYKGKPITSGMVLFVNHETGAGATGELDASGRYHVPALETGEYKVTITRPRTPGPSELEAGVPMPKLSVNLPNELTNPQTSGLKFTVAETQNTFNLDL